MELSIFEVLGPVMIGPSSSHTAGAARLARVAALIDGRPFDEVRFVLHGSFLRTGAGHGTLLALLAGALGIAQDDERLKDALALARERGVRWAFEAGELEGAHENSVRITFHHADGSTLWVQGSSIGGGRIRITHIDGLPTDIAAEQPTLIVQQNDVSGVISEITTLLAQAGINIGVMRLARQARGRLATTVLEVDDAVPPALVERLRTLPNVRSVRMIQP